MINIKLTDKTPDERFLPVEIPALKANDYTMRQLRAFVEANGQQQQQRSKQIDGIKYEGMDPNDPRDLIFTANSQDKTQRYTLRLRFFDFGNMLPKGKKDVIQLLNYTDIGVHCNCPSFLYWGAAYKADRMGYGVVRESRAPKDPNKKKKDTFYACKHSQAVLRHAPFWWPQVRKDYVAYYEALAKQAANEEMKEAETPEEAAEIKKETEENWS